MIDAAFSVSGTRHEGAEADASSGTGHRTPATRLLVIQTAFLGDVVLATPLLEALHAAYPAASIDILVRRGNEGLLAGHPFLRRVLVWDKKNGKYRDLLRLLGLIRRERYDWVINAQRFAASGLLTVLSGAGHTVGFDKNPLSVLFSRRVPHRLDYPARAPWWTRRKTQGDLDAVTPPYVPNGRRFSAHEPRHEVDRNLDLIAHLLPAELRGRVRPRLYPSEADYTRARTLAGTTPYICVAPTSVWFTKQLPADNWVELLRRLPAPTRVFLLGAPADADACEAIRAAVGCAGVENLAGQLGLLESAALMAGAQMNYVNDSAPLHLASALDAPVTAVFCSTVPEFGFGPLSTDSTVIQTSLPLPCKPCGLHGHRACPLGHFHCATTISWSGKN